MSKPKDDNAAGVGSGDLLAAMVQLSDDELYSLIRDALEKRKVEYYKDCADDYGWPTRHAKLAVMRQICCS